MFIIGGLLLVKVFQKRHPDIHANAFVAFFSFAVIIVCTLIGIVSWYNHMIIKNLIGGGGGGGGDRREGGREEKGQREERVKQEISYCV